MDIWTYEILVLALGGRHLPDAVIPGMDHEEAGFIGEQVYAVDRVALEGFVGDCADSLDE